MTILSEVIGAAQLISGLVSTAKNARDLAKDSSDHALKAAVGELYDVVLDIKDRVIDLDEENRRLKAQLQQRSEIVGPSETHGYFFYKDKPDNPLCPKCLQSLPSNAVFLGPLNKYKGGKLRRCPVCTYGCYEEPPSTGEAMAIGPSLSERTRGYWS